MTVRFDESLSTLVDFVVAELGDEAVAKSVFVRDAVGLLSVAIDLELSDERLAELELAVSKSLGGYARTENPVRDKSGPGVKKLFEAGKRRPNIVVEGRSISFVDRRLVGADWLLPPQSADGVPRIVFTSLKGGVGRSTALAVLAAHMSSRGQRVLAIDLDLEAPGIGTMLIQPNALPKYGTLDYLVENGISGIDREFVTQMIGKSFLGSTGAQVSVLPAIGRATIENPRGALSKISRAYLEDVSSSGEVSSQTNQIREMVDRFSATGDYDLILIDGRAGLHETNAAVLLGLGAEILFFGIDEPQTFLGYSLLFSHLADFRGAAYDEWRSRVQFVQAKCSADPAVQRESAVRFSDLFDVLHPPGGHSGRGDALATESLTADDFDLEWAEDDALDMDEVLYEEAAVIKILDDQRYQGFNPIAQRSLLTPDLFGTTFRDLLNWAESLLPALQVDVDDN
ncbi:MULTISPECIES: tyrosine-protein kinase family protein [Mesorhizobium]|uniref:AAA domain-containing protein n=2 Tax=Mesorhizobium TaxID=68287 RepID=A0A1A5HUV7_RHILI|nr:MULTISPECIES: AAA family ATPase [Mesorhizobium]ETA72405.1 ATPase involved in chromosome partitioning [Mesorhizobium japonicum R7A]MBE1709733.1 tyrosine-protein kinase family protein [Mesorhizobium japonicum]MBE1714402.1 tyrosine-protein kinase family protein [Mesorhizobium japonicum]MUT22015.1 AAA family ATPase [Mesorhizobium japonicum]MUT28564.1 AAA family ATPase [Mesorhizobium japonicum]